MAEESHKAAMADALRGDFARLRARGVSSTLVATDSEAEFTERRRSRVPERATASRIPPALPVREAEPTPPSGGTRVEAATLEAEAEAEAEATPVAAAPPVVENVSEPGESGRSDESVATASPARLSRLFRRR